MEYISSIIDTRWALAAVAVLLAGVVRGFSGFGAGLILVPTLGVLYGPVEAVVSVMLLELIPTAQMLPRALKHCHWPSAAPMLLMATLTIPLGSFVLVVMDEHLVRGLIAVVVLLGCAWLASGRRLVSATVSTRSGPLLTGGLSGLLSGAVGLGGLPVVMYYLSGTHRAQATRSSIIVILLASVLVSLITFLLHGIVSEQIVMRCLTLAPLLLFATWLGGCIFGRVSEQLFRRLLLILLSMVGLVTLAI
jgi:uncharacterized membrane protein YfcA